MIAGDDYKRAARQVEASDANALGPARVPECVLRLAWALARVAAVPTPDLAQRLADALIEISGPACAAMVQLGRCDAKGRWRAEALGVAGRAAGEANTGGGQPQDLPWPSDPPRGDGPVYLVSEPPAGEPSLAPIEAALRRVNLEIELAAMARSPGVDGIVLTVQLGGHRTPHTRARAALLGQVLPWVYAIARAALGEDEGEVEGGPRREWLTDREHEVLEQLVRGDSVVEIARTLERSRYTVHDHVKSLHRKLGVRSRAALVGCVTAGVAPPAHAEQAPLERSGHQG